MRKKWCSEKTTAQAPAALPALAIRPTVYQQSSRTNRRGRFSQQRWISSIISLGNDWRSGSIAGTGRAMS